MTNLLAESFAFYWRSGSSGPALFAIKTRKASFEVFVGRTGGDGVPAGVAKMVKTHSSFAKELCISSGWRAGRDLFVERSALRFLSVGASASPYHHPECE